MATFVDSNELIEIHQPDGTVKRIFPITKLENIVGAEKLTEIQTRALKLLAVNSYIVDDVTGKTYKIGVSDGKMYAEESSVSVLDLLNTIGGVISTPTPTEPTT